MSTDPQPTPTRRRGLRRLVAAQGLSSAGDGAFLAAAPLAAAAITRDPAAVAIVAAAEYLPWVLVAPLAGVYVDRWPRKPTMVVADLARAVAVAGLAVLVATGTASIATISLCAFLMVAGVVFHSSASEAIVADLAGRDSPELHATNGQLQTAYTVGRQLIGPPAGSFGFAAASWIPFAGDAVSFVVSSALVAAVPHTTPRNGRHRSVWAELREGAAFLATHRALRTLAVLVAIANLAANMGMGVLVLYATDPTGLGITTAGYGLLLVAMAIGGIAGGIGAPRVLRRVGAGPVLLGSLAAEAAGFALLACTSNPIVGGLALAIVWVGVSGVGIVVTGARQQQTPPEMLGRVISAFRVLGNGTAPLGALLGGLLALHGLRLAIIGAAVILTAAVGAAFATRRA